MLYKHRYGVATDINGKPVPGASVRVWDNSRGELATIYFDDGVQEKGNPFLTASRQSEVPGWWDFWVNSPSISISFGSGVVPPLVSDVEAETIEAHRQQPRHADGSIQSEELAPGILEQTTDLALHESKVRGVHGIPANGAAAVAYSTRQQVPGQATSDPAFGAVLVQTLLDFSSKGVFFHGTKVADPTVDSIMDAVAEATDGDVIFVKGTPGAEVDVAWDSSIAFPIGKSLTFVGIGMVRMTFSGAYDFMTITGNQKVAFYNFHFIHAGTAGKIVNATTFNELQLHNVKLEGSQDVGLYAGPGTLSRQAIVLRDVEIFNCAKEGFKTSGVVGPITAHGLNCHENGTAGGYYEMNLNKGGQNPAGGARFFSCRFNNALLGVRVDVEDVLFLGTHFDCNGGEALNITNNALRCVAPGNGYNVIAGTITDGSGNRIDPPITPTVVTVKDDGSVSVAPTTIIEFKASDFAVTDLTGTTPQKVQIGLADAGATFSRVVMDLVAQEFTVWGTVSAGDSETHTVGTFNPPGSHGNVMVIVMGAAKNNGGDPALIVLSFDSTTDPAWGAIIPGHSEIGFTAFIQKDNITDASHNINLTLVAGAGGSVQMTNGVVAGIVWTSG